MRLTVTVVAALALASCVSTTPPAGPPPRGVTRLPRDPAVPARLAGLPAWEAATACNAVTARITVNRAHALGGMANFDEEVKRTGYLTRLYWAYAQRTVAIDRQIGAPMASKAVYDRGRIWDQAPPSRRPTLAECEAFAPVVERLLDAS